MNKLLELSQRGKAPEMPAEDPADIKLLSEIRDLLKANA
jgi:large-conductance mechanosensitive channel